VRSKKKKIRVNPIDRPIRHQKSRTRRGAVYGEENHTIARGVKNSFTIGQYKKTLQVCRESFHRSNHRSGLIQERHGENFLSGDRR